MSRARTHPTRHAAQRAALVQLLQGGRAHAPLAEVLRDFPYVLVGRKPRGAPHTPWQLMEHLRIAQRDILDFSRDPRHASPPWPEGYWPLSATPPSARAWARSKRAFLDDLEATAIARDAKRDLGHPIPGTNTTWFGQLGLAASHNSYHLGQLVFLRRALEAGRARAGARVP